MILTRMKWIQEISLKEPLVIAEEDLILHNSSFLTKTPEEYDTGKGREM